MASSPSGSKAWPEQQVADLKGLLFSLAFVVPTAIRILGDLDHPIPPTQEAHFHLFAELASRPKWQDLATLALLAKKRAQLSDQPALATALSHWLDTALATRQWTAAQLEGHAMEHLQHLRADGLPHVVLEVSWERDPNVDPRLVIPGSYLRIGGQPWALG